MRTSFALLLVILSALSQLFAGEPSLAADAIDRDLVRQAISAFLKDHGAIPRDGSGPWIALIGHVGGPDELRKLFDQIAGEGFTPDSTVRALEALTQAAARNARPAPREPAVDPALDRDFETLTRLLLAPDVKLQAAAARLAGVWKMESTANRLAELAAGPDPNVRASAFAALRQFGGKTALTFFFALVQSDQRPEMRRAALVAIAEINLDAAVVQAADVLPAIESEEVALETWRGLLKIEGAPNAFAVRLPKALPAPVITAGLRAAGEIGKRGERISGWACEMSASFPALNSKRMGCPASSTIAPTLLFIPPFVRPIAWKA